MFEYGGIKELLVCLVFASVLATPEWVKEVELVWKKAWFGYLLIVAGVCIFSGFCRQLPPSGHAITAMAVVAGVMALRPEMGGREKWLWFALLLAFMGVEIKAINKDRQDQATKFEDTARGLTTAINTQTGGDGFAYITFTPEPANFRFNQFPATPGPQFLVSITSHGKYPLREIRIILMDDERRITAMEEYNKHPNGEWMKAIQSTDTTYQYQYLRPQSPEAPSGDVEVLGMYPFPRGDSKRLSIAFSSLNGYWNETLHLGLVDGAWRQCLSVVGPTVKQEATPFIYCEPEWPEGRALAERDWPHIKRP